MKTMINKSHIEGLLYEHALELKTSGPNSKTPGTEFISGTISIATDNAGINIVPIHFTYVTAKTAKNKENQTFTTLNNIISGSLGSIMKDGKENAAKLRIDSAVDLNEFYSDKSGKEELISAKRNEGGFVHTADVIAEDEKTRNTFECDMIITGTTRIEANEEKQTPEKVIIKGAVFNFRGELLPVDFSATNPNAMNYFEGLGATNQEPVFTKVWGRQLSEVITKTITEESAFGEDSVKEVKSTRKDFVVTGAAKEPYTWDDSASILASELAEAMTARQTKLATMKQRQDEYKASKGTTAPAAAPAQGGFNF